MSCAPVNFTKLPRYYPDYEHVKCTCGGVIGSYDRGNTFTCDRCGEVYDLYKLDYDNLRINDVTGWIFPIKYKENAKCQ
jgi:hypothetical protein